MRFRNLAIILSVLAAACSSNPGFGGGGVGGGLPGPNSAPNGVNPQGVAGQSAGSAPPSAAPGASALPAASSTGIDVAGAMARLAFDGSTSDPNKASKILILTFSLKNNTARSISVRKLSITSAGDLRSPAALAKSANAANPTNLAVRIGDKRAAAAATPAPQTAAVALDVGSGKTSEVRIVGVTASPDIAAYSQVNVNFLPDKGAPIASTKLDVAPADVSFTPLDEKAPKGGTTIDSVEIGGLDMPGPGPHYKATFAVTNASAQRSSFDQIVIKPPSGLAVKIALPIDMPPRTTTSFITIVAPFTGKALPAGSYAVQALYHGVTIASGSGDIL